MKIGFCFTIIVIMMTICSCNTFKPVPLNLKEIDDAYEVESFVVMLTDNDSLNKVIRDTLKVRGYELTDSCNCSPGLLLYGPGEVVNPVERTKEGVATVEDVEGSAGLNVDIFPPDRPRNRIEDRALGVLSFLLKTPPRVSPPALRRSPSGNDNRKTVRIAVLDDGVNYGHELLEGREMLYNSGEGCEYSTGDWGANEDADSHATKVAVSSLYTYGNYESNFKVEFLNLNIFKNGKGSLFRGLCSIRRAINNNVDAINISWGFYESQESELDYDERPILATTNILEKIILEANEKEIPVIAAAGNNGVDIDVTPFYPAAFASKIDFVIGVGATGYRANKVAAYSNVGDQCVRVFAPGSVKLVDEGMAFFGTSYAAPRISLAAAILHRIRATNSDAIYKRDIQNLKKGGASWEQLILNRTREEESID